MEDGAVVIQAKAVILATGCYERNAGAIQIPGDRPAGVITAGTAQKYLNLEGYLVGKRVLILGSGDIGLIMARRMTLEGAKVLAVCEIMPYSNGLNRNIAQCLNDYNIPLYLSHSVSKVIGKDRVEKVIVSQVDEHMKFIPGTEMEFECDTLLLSIGLIPNVNILHECGAEISSTKGMKVDEHMMSTVPGLFSCGNCLHVHDLVDFVSQEGRTAGHGAALFIKGLKEEKEEVIKVNAKDGVGYVVPQFIDKKNTEPLDLKFRVRKPVKNVNIIISSGDKIIKKLPKLVLIPSEMEMVKINPELLNDIQDEIEVRLEERK
jgi:pyruvate/2-oxoglutarate dehydrogenase complex dihydrolipoamide dehydrogenase (E3) component